MLKSSNDTCSRQVRDASLLRLIPEPPILKELVRPLLCKSMKTTAQQASVFRPTSILVSIRAEWAFVGVFRRQNGRQDRESRRGSPCGQGADSSCLCVTASVGRLSRAPCGFSLAGRFGVSGTLQHALAERHGSRTHPGQDHCPADGFEDRGGHRTTSRSARPIFARRPPAVTRAVSLGRRAHSSSAWPRLRRVSSRTTTITTASAAATPIKIVKVELPPVAITPSLLGLRLR